MSTSLDKLDLKDKYSEALREVINAKIQGKEIVTYAPETPPVVDIMTALKESIEQARSQREPMVKATGKAKKAKAEPELGEGKAAKTRKTKLA
jgi:DNA end-binding protein Ku